MKRRDLLELLCGAVASPAWLPAAAAQQAGKVARLGYLASNPANRGPIDAFRRGLIE